MAMDMQHCGTSMKDVGTHALLSIDLATRKVDPKSGYSVETYVCLTCGAVELRAHLVVKGSK